MLRASIHTLLALLASGGLFADELRERGELVATSGAGNAPCMSCHGSVGEGIAAANFPRLAGLGQSYLKRQLELFSSGERASPIMAAIARSLSDEDKKAVSLYYASLTYAVKEPIDSPGNPVARKLVYVGDWDRSVPACTQCHGPRGEGVGSDFPPLRGQSLAYIRAQLLAFRKGERAGDPLELMSKISRNLSESEIDALAKFYGE